MPSIHPPRAASGAHRLAGLDALRGLAAVAIVVLHVWLYTTTTSADRDGLDEAVIHQFRLALTLFFVLSGYLLYRGWVAAVIDGRQRPRMGRYALSRARRLAPGAWLCLAITAPVLVLLDDVRGVVVPDAHLLPLFAVFAQGVHPETLARLNPPMWTLTVEASFYLVLPLLGVLAARLVGSSRIAPRTALMAPAVLLVVLGTAWNAWLALRPQGSGLLLASALPALAPCFAAGMAAAVLAHGATLRPRHVRALAILGVAVVVAGGWWHESGAAGTSIAGRVIRDFGAAVGFAALVVTVAHAARPVRLLSRGPLPWLGERSYGVYLWHMPVIYVLRGAGVFPEGRTTAAVLVVFALVVPIAHLSWTLVERPALRWSPRRRGEGKPRPRPDRPNPRPVRAGTAATRRPGHEPRVAGATRGA